jgi:taurine--2-oxoglutarate transaminase
MDKAAGVLEAAEAAVLEKQYVLQPWLAQSSYSPMVITRAQGCYFWDEKGNRYLDFQSQLVNVNAGHQHPRIIKAIKEQADRLCYALPATANQRRGLLAKMLAERTPGDLGKSFLVTGGAEANENALKIARAVTGRQKVIARYRSYHGSTYGAASVMGDPRRRGVEPGVPGAVRVWDAFCYRCFFKMSYPSCGLYCAKAIREVIEVEGPETIAAMIVEPVTASNCRLVPPPGYLAELRGICDEYGVLLIFDEVMTGFGRTGKWFAAEHWNVIPDMMTLSKGINNGTLPLGAVVVRPKIAQFFDERMLSAGMTQSGNPIACAAAIETMRVYEEERMVENSQRLGRHLLQRLEELKERHPSVGDVRGLGLFAAIDLVKDRQSREPLVPWTIEWAEKKDPTVKAVLNRLTELGVFTYSRWSVIMVCPPLCITREQLDEGLDKLDEALKLADERVAALTR